MGYTMERWYSAAGQRFSMRKYAGAPDAAEMAEIEAAARMLSGDGVRILLCEGEVFQPIFLGAGRVKGTDRFAAILGAEDALCRCGYIGESFILECTALGVGTCWLGGSYKKGMARKLMGIAPQEGVACIVALGKPGESYIGRPRKALSALTGMTQAQLVDLPEWQQSALSCARLAPSAVNAQPWRFTVEGERLGICRTGANFGFARLDQGIAMLHMELGAAHGGVAGEWAWEGDTAVFQPTAG